MTEPISRRTLVLALALTPGIGSRTITRVLTRNDLLARDETMFSRLGVEALVEEYRLSRSAAQAWVTSRDERLAESVQLKDRLERLGVRWITAAEASYPRRIENMDEDPPGVLFLYGNVGLLQARTFAVASSRGASEEVLRRIERLTEEGVLAGETLVSGHDTREYQASAVVPLRWGAPRILVLDRGLFHALGENLDEEPFRAARLWRFRFDPTTDLVMSMVRPDQAYHRNSNRIRDRVIAALADRLDLPFASQGGNMERLAKSALRCGRKVRIAEDSPLASELVALGAEHLPPS